MPQVYRVRSRRLAHLKRTLRKIPPLVYVLITVMVGCFCALCAIGGILFNMLIDTDSDVAPMPPELPPGSYMVVGKPSIDAAFIDQVLDHYRSPARGKGQVLYDYGLKYNIDPAYALAFFMHESTFGTQGVARVTLSLGNIRATEGHPSYQGFRKYNTWEEGFEDWYRLIAKVYVRQWRLYTVDQIIPVYAPAKDNNNEAAYIRAVKLAVSRWKSGVV